MKKTIPIILAIVCLGIASFFLFREKAAPAPDFDSEDGNVPAEGKPSVSQKDKERLVEEYVRANITSISPEEEVLGGKFFVTGIEFSGDNSGRVEYEDGHNQFVSAFTYGFTPGGNVKIINVVPVIEDGAYEMPQGDWFAETGNVAGGEGSWDFVYEIPGSPALRIGLVFAPYSTCDTGTGRISCQGAEWQAGARAYIEGVRQGDTVTVSKFTLL